MSGETNPIPVKTALAHLGPAEMIGWADRPDAVLVSNNLGDLVFGMEKGL